MAALIDYRRGELKDLSTLEFSEGLSATQESIEFNVFGMGHELWIAVKGTQVIGLSVLGRPDLDEFKIMFLEVTPSEKNHGVGSGLIEAMLENHAGSEFSVIPFEGTEEFYRRLGFHKSGQWEMRKPAISRSKA